MNDKLARGAKQVMHAECSKECTRHTTHPKPHHTRAATLYRCCYAQSRPSGSASCCCQQLALACHRVAAAVAAAAAAAAVSAAATTITTTANDGYTAAAGSS